MAGELPRGIVPVLQTPFDERGEIDFESLSRLIEDALDAGATGFLAPAVASEVEQLSPAERERLTNFISSRINRRVTFIAGASAPSPEESRFWAKCAVDAGADAFLIQVPPHLYGSPQAIAAHLTAATSGCELPFILQDLEWQGPGLDLETISLLSELLPNLKGLKVETVPAGPKYSAVREKFGDSMYIAGGWAVMQMIEALDRGVDAMMPEASMVRVYAEIFHAHRNGERERAVSLFRKLLAVLAFTNQEINVSIAFFKALLVRRGVFRTERMRRTGFEWDLFNRRIAEELIQVYLNIEADAVTNRKT